MIFDRNKGLLAFTNNTKTIIAILVTVNHTNILIAVILRPQESNSLITQDHSAPIINISITQYPADFPNIPIPQKQSTHVQTPLSKHLVTQEFHYSRSPLPKDHPNMSKLQTSENYIHKYVEKKSQYI